MSATGDAESREPLDPEYSDRDIFDLSELLERKDAKDLLHDTTFYKEQLKTTRIYGQDQPSNQHFPLRE